MSDRKLSSILLLAMMFGFGCAVPQEAQSSPDLDEAFFACQVQPLLTKYCGTFVCHGDSRRYLTIYARNRLRFDIVDENERNMPLSEDERAFNYESARALVDGDDPEQSWLLLKPLEQSAGGYYHVGAETFGGGDVFTDVDDRDYRLLLRWASGERQETVCPTDGL